MASNEKQQPPTASTPDTQPRPGDSSGSNDSENDNGNDNSDAASIGGQRTTMAPRALTISVLTLSVCLLVSFIDQTSVSTVTPMIAEELDTGTLTSWIGASFLVASTAFQMINGRLSDIFGRKNLLLVCLALIAVGDLACGFSRTAAQLFAFRSIAGVGGGGVNSLVMIIVSDITTLEKRGKYQGVSPICPLCVVMLRPVV